MSSTPENKLRKPPNKLLLIVLRVEAYYDKFSYYYSSDKIQLLVPFQNFIRVILRDKN